MQRAIVPLDLVKAGFDQLDACQLSAAQFLPRSVATSKNAVEAIKERIFNQGKRIELRRGVSPAVRVLFVWGGGGGV